MTKKEKEMAFYCTFARIYSLYYKLANVDFNTEILSVEPNLRKRKCFVNYSYKPHQKLILLYRTNPS